MIIGIDGSEAFVKHKTGVENYAYQILKNLSQIDQNNTYLIYLDPRTNSKDLVAGRHGEDWPDNFKFKYLSWPIMWTQLGLAWQTYIDHLDLLFIPGHTLPILKNPLLKSVVTVHDLGAEYLPAYHQWKQRLYLGLMTKLQIRFATKIIAVSEATKKDLIKKVGIKSSKIQVIYEALVPKVPITPRKVDKNDSQVDIFTQFDIKKKNYFLFVGTIQPRKNLERLIRAYDKYFSKSDGPKLILVGNRGWLSDSIYELVKIINMQDQILFLGRQSDSTVQFLYENCLAVVYPSLFEGFGLPILDAFQYEVPIITSNTSSMPEVAGDAALLVDPNSSDEIGEAMFKLCHDAKLRQELVRKGREQLKKFSWEKAAQKTLELFLSI